MIIEKLQSLGLSLPDAPKPVAAYIPAKRDGNIIYVSGQLPVRSGELMLTGIIDSDDKVAEAQKAIGQCFLNALAAVTSITPLENIKGVLRLCAFVASSPDFTSQHLVANGASELALSLFGESGRHSRSAVGVASLPLNAAVELEVQFLV